MVTQAQDVDAPQPPSQVVDRRNSPLLQAHLQDLIIGSPLKGVMTTIRLNGCLACLNTV